MPTSSPFDRHDAPPLPTPSRADVVVEPPGSGPGYWAGAPSAVVVDGVTWLAYRLRRPVGEGRGLRRGRGPLDLSGATPGTLHW